ncbi:MAG: nucleolar zinc-finger protein [Pleopsidium flavum]|nr:MAG: nucleolar zinc-finger protein [Pleopsidium flavum]
MANHPHNEPLNLMDRPNSEEAQHENLFEDVGKKVEGMSLGETANTEGNGDEDQGPKLVDEIESYCMNCGENGTTRLLLTKIPYFREIILMSFYCHYCHFKNSEIQSAGEIQERGSKYTLKLDHMDDFERQVVKSDTAIFRVEDLDIEIPAGRGQLTNVEGILIMVLKDLEADQPRRKRHEPELFAKVDAIVQPLIKMMHGVRFPFKISLDDPAGNAWIEPSPDDKDGNYVNTDYARSPEQNAALGLGNGVGKVEDTEEAAPAEAQDAAQEQEPVRDPNFDVDIVNGEPLIFHTDCPGCTKPCEVRMRMVDVPHFKQVVLISTACDHCGYRTSEVKTGGAIPDKGRQIILKVLEQVDLSRDVLKSETCTIFCPELKLEITPGTMSGRFTTVEGLLTQVHDTLYSRIFDAGGAGGDARDPERKQVWDNLFSNLQAAIKGEFKYQIALTDPLAASYVQNLCSPDEDPQLTILDYERSEEEEEELGLTDMRTELDDTGKYRNAVVQKAVMRAERLADDQDAKLLEREEAEKKSLDAKTVEQEVDASDAQSVNASETKDEGTLGGDGQFKGEESVLYIKQPSRAKPGFNSGPGSGLVKNQAEDSGAKEAHLGADPSSSSTKEHCEQCEHCKAKAANLANADSAAGSGSTKEESKAKAPGEVVPNAAPAEKDDYVVVEHDQIEDDWSEASTAIDRMVQ